MKNRKNLLLAVLLFVVVAIASASTYAWLTEEGSTNTISYEVGEVHYEITSPATPTDVVVPGESLGNVEIVNHSNVLTNIRVKFSVTVTGAAEGANTTWSVGTAAATDEVLLSQPAGSTWTLVEGYYYLGGKGAANTSGNEDVAVAAETGTELAPLFDNLVLNGALVGNDYAGATITITVTFEAKQAEHIEWDAMGSIDFSTGVARVTN